MSVELRPFILGDELDPRLRALGIVVNRLVNRDNGNAPGRIWLWDDDGSRRAILGGEEIDADNYPFWVRAGSGNHGRFERSDEAGDVLLVQDDGVTLEGAFDATGDVAITGDTALTGGLTVSGATAANGGLTTTTITASGAAALNGNVTLGDAAADTITVNGTPTFNENVVMAKNLTVDTTTLVVDATNNKVGVLVTPAASSAPFEVGGIMRSTSHAPAPSGGTGLELFYNTVAGAGTIQAYNRSGSVATKLRLLGSTVTVFDGAGTVRIDVSATGVAFNGATPVAPPSLPADATDLASAETLVNAIKDLLEDVGLAS